MYMYMYVLIGVHVYNVHVHVHCVMSFSVVSAPKNWIKGKLLGSGAFGQVCTEHVLQPLECVPYVYACTCTMFMYMHVHCNIVWSTCACIMIHVKYACTQNMRCPFRH